VLKGSGDFSMLSLRDLCIRGLYVNPSLLDSLHILPVELVDLIFQTLAKLTVLSDSHLACWQRTQAKDFDFTNCKFITDNGLKDFVQRFYSLESLKLCESGTTSQSLPQIVAYCTNIRSLDISDVALKESDFNILKRCTTLRSLTAKKSLGLKAKSVSKLLQHCSCIFTTLNSYCQK
jgi:hypothetical protein